MLKAFIRSHALDILLLQEVTHQIFTVIHGYNTFYNIGTTHRGIAIIARDELPINKSVKYHQGARSPLTCEICQ